MSPNPASLRTRFLLGAVGLAVVVRLVPWLLMWAGLPLDPTTTTYPWNFSPVTAVCLFAAAYTPRAGWSLLVPLLIGLLGDVGIGLLSGRLGFALYPSLPFVYAGHLVSTLLGLALVRRPGGKRSRLLAVLGTGVAAELVFFLISNFGSWFTGTTYPHTRTGLVACYVAGLPYLRNGLVGTAFYGTALFTGFAWLSARATTPDTAASPETTPIGESRP